MARKPRSPGPGGLSPEDLDLWRRVTRDLRPLAKRPPAKRPPAKRSPAKRSPAPAADKTAPPEQATGPDTPAAAPPAAARRPARKGAPAPGSTSEPPPPAAPDLAHGESAGLDRRSALRLRRGQHPIDGRIDLHGMTQAAAARALDAFLAESQAAGRRCVLVITGKGTTSEGGGVLRREVPRWLNRAPNRARVLGFDYALPRDGGQGALYVLLRRADKRPPRR